MGQAGQYSASDVAPTPPAQTGQYSAADVVETPADDSFLGYSPIKSSKLNPMHLVYGAGDALVDTVSGAYHAFADAPHDGEAPETSPTLLRPLERTGLAMGRMFVDPMQAEFDKAQQAEAAGDTLGKWGHAIASGVPVLGPMVASLVEKGEENPLQAVGQAGAYTAMPTVAKEVMPAGILSKVRGAAGNTASFLSDVVDPEITGIISPRLAHLQRFLGRIGEKLKPDQQADLFASLPKVGDRPPSEGLVWIDNLLAADEAGTQPLPRTKAAIAKSYPQMDTAFSRESVANQAAPGQPSATKTAPTRTGQLLLTEGVPEKILQTVQEAEQSGVKYPEQALGSPMSPDRPYYEAAKQQLGENATTTDVASRARDLKNQDAYLSGVIQRNTSPRTMSGESALRTVLTGQDNANLMRIAKSRGINVTQEAQLKPGVADTKLINKIVDNFSPDELNEIGDRYTESTRFRHNFGDIGPEAWKTLGMETYFPDVKLPKTVQTRTAQAISSQTPQTPEAQAAQLAKTAPGLNIMATLQFMNKAKQELGMQATLAQITKRAQELQAQAGQ